MGRCGGIMAPGALVCPPHPTPSQCAHHTMVHGVSIPPHIWLPIAPWSFALPWAATTCPPVPTCCHLGLGVTSQTFVPRSDRAGGDLQCSVRHCGHCNREVSQAASVCTLCRCQCRTCRDVYREPLPHEECREGPAAPRGAAKGQGMKKAGSQGWNWSLCPTSLASSACSPGTDSGSGYGSGSGSGKLDQMPCLRVVMGTAVLPPTAGCARPSALVAPSSHPLCLWGPSQVPLRPPVPFP